MNEPVFRSSSYIEPTIVFLAVLLLLKLASGWPLLGSSGLTVPILFVWLPCLLLLCNRTTNEKLGIGSGIALKQQLSYLLTLLPVLLLYSIFHFFVLDRLVQFSSPVKKIDFTLLGIFFAFVFECAYVALPEEFFFRGYLQGAAKGKENSWWSIVYAAFLFAVIHVAVNANPRRFEVFFPGLLFGWYREKTKAIWISIMAHAACNVTFYCLLQKALLT